MVSMVGKREGVERPGESSGNLEMQPARQVVIPRTLGPHRQPLPYCEALLELLPAYELAALQVLIEVISDEPRPNTQLPTPRR